MTFEVEWPSEAKVTVTWILSVILVGDMYGTHICQQFFTPSLRTREFVGRRGIPLSQWSISMLYSGLCDLRPLYSIPCILRPMQWHHLYIFSINILYFKTTFNLRPYFADWLGGLKLQGPLYMISCSQLYIHWSLCNNISTLDMYYGTVMIQFEKIHSGVIWHYIRGVGGGGIKFILARKARSHLKVLIRFVSKCFSLWICNCLIVNRRYYRQYWILKQSCMGTHCH